MVSPHNSRSPGTNFGAKDYEGSLLIASSGWRSDYQSVCVCVCVSLTTVEACDKTLHFSVRESWNVFIVLTNIWDSRRFQLAM